VQTEVAGELGADDNKLEFEGLLDGLLSGDPVGVIVVGIREGLGVPSLSFPCRPTLPATGDLEIGLLVG
jgi:hypothetical protein